MRTRTHFKSHFVSKQYRTCRPGPDLVIVASKLVLFQIEGSEFLDANILRKENSNLDLNLGRGAQTAFSLTATGALTEEC